MRLQKCFEKYNGFIFDLDGTIYRGERIIEKADKTINFLKSIGKRIVFVSNKTTDTVSDYYNFLKKYNFAIEEKEIINATTIIRKHLLKNYKASYFYAIGEEKFIKELKKVGLKYSSNPREIDILIVTLDRSLDYQKLETAALALENGARFFAANIDDTCPVSGGEILDAGSTISALEKRTHRKLELYFGKPSKYIFEEALALLQLPKEEIIIIGDRIQTDIEMANRFGVDSVLVNTGVKNIITPENKQLATYILPSVFSIFE